MVVHYGDNALPDDQNIVKNYAPIVVVLTYLLASLIWPVAILSFIARMIIIGLKK